MAVDLRVARRQAGAFADDDVELCRRIGEAGFGPIDAAYRRAGRRVNMLTHGNAGGLATVDGGAASALIYLAHDRGAPVHVGVEEPRPRLLQGRQSRDGGAIRSLTARALIHLKL